MRLESHTVLILIEESNYAEFIRIGESKSYVDNLLSCRSMALKDRLRRRALR